MITLIQYTSSKHIVEKNLTPSEADDMVKSGKINWLDVDISDRDFAEEIAHLFKIHPILIDDIVSVEHLPKFELFEDYIFFSAKMLKYNIETETILQEHLSIVLGKNVLITFQEGLPGDVFDELRSKIALSKGLIRKNTIDYLFYQIIAALIESYLNTAEILREKIETLESQLLADNRFDVSTEVIKLKQKIILLRKYTIPMWDSINRFKSEGVDFIKKGNYTYFQDIGDQINFLLSFYDTSREMLRDLMDLNQSNLNNETNRVMRTLTVVSAIFIPMTFIAGLYGMNFKNMHELDYRYGYPGVLLLMGLTAMTIIIILKKKKWL